MNIDDITLRLQMRCQESLPELVYCDAVVDEGMIQTPTRVLMPRPACLVSLMKAERAEQNPGFHLALETHWLAVLLTDNDAPGKGARVLAFELAQALERWTLGTYGLPICIQSIAPGITDEELRSGVNLWEVEWSQIIYLAS